MSKAQKVFYFCFKDIGKIRPKVEPLTNDFIAPT